MAKHSKRSAAEAFQDVAHTGSKSDTKSKRRKRGRRDPAAEQLRSENDIYNGAEESEDVPGNADDQTPLSTSTPAVPQTIERGQSTKRQRRRQKEKLKKGLAADKLHDTSLHSVEDAADNPDEEQQVSKSMKQKKKRKREYLLQDPQQEVHRTETEESPKKKKRKKHKHRHGRDEQRTQENSVQDQDASDHEEPVPFERLEDGVEVAREDDGRGDSKPADEERIQHFDSAKVQIETPRPKKRSQRKGKRRHDSPKPEQQNAWSLSVSAGCAFIDHAPIMTVDDEHLIVPTRFDVRVFARSTSLLVGRLQPHLRDPKDQIISCAISKSRNSHLLIATSAGSIFLWDWIHGNQLAKWKSIDNLSQIIPMASNSKAEHVLTLSRFPGAKESTLSIRTLDTTSPTQSVDFELLKRPDLNPNVWFFEDSGVIITTVYSRLLLGYRPTGQSSQKSRALFEWRELQLPAGIVSLDARSANERRSLNTPRVDIAVGVQSGEIMVYEDLLFKMIGREKKNDGSEISTRILHWHRHAVNTVKWSRDGNYLISGGLETVLVIWQLDTNRQQFLPHLSSQIMDVTISSTGSAYAIRLADNSIMVLSSANLDATTHIAGFGASNHTQTSLTASLHPISPDQLLIAAPKDASHQGLPAFNLQTYDLHSDREIGRQTLTRNATTTINTASKDQHHLEPNVTHLQLSADGKWLATIEEWSTDPSQLDGVKFESEDGIEGLTGEVCLKIWLYNEQLGDWELVNRIGDPHSHASRRVLALISNPARNEFATAGTDGKVRIWQPRARVRDGVPVRNEDGEQLHNWTQTSKIFCTTVQEQKSPQQKHASSIAMAYSPDGTVIAASWSLPAKFSGPRWVHLIDSDKGEICGSAHDLLTNGAGSVVFTDRYLVCLSDNICIYDTVSSQRLSKSPLELEYQGFRSNRNLAANSNDGTVAVGLSKVDGKPSGRLAIITVAAEPTVLFETTIPAQIKGLLTSPAMQGYLVIDNNSRIHHLRRTGEIITSSPRSTASTNVPKNENADTRRGLDRIFGRHPTSTLAPVQTTQEAPRLKMLTNTDEQAARGSLEDVLSFQTTAQVPGVRELFRRVAGWFAGGATGS